MRLFGVLFTVAAAIGAAVADAANPILTPAFGQNILAGQSLTITWTPSTPGPITLTLRFGSTSSLSSGTEIASGIKNSGTFTWPVPTDFGSGWYTVQIVDSSNGATNYSPTFSISGGTGVQGVSATGVTATSTSSSPSGTTAAFTTGTAKSDASALTGWSARNCGLLAAFCGVGAMVAMA